MIQFEKSLHAWGRPDFKGVLKQEIEQLDADQLPLQQGLSGSNHVADEPLTVIINSVAETDHSVRVKAGIFYTGLLLGCSCADDPSPPGESNEYCEVLVEIDKVTAATTVVLAAE